MRGKKKGTAPHWRLIDNAEVQSVARAVARSIADMNQGVLEEDDLYQEGLTLIAATPHLAERAVLEEYGLLYTRLRTELRQRFVDKMQRSGELRARKYRNIAIEDADDEPQPHIVFDDGSGDYNDDAVRLLLPAVWDESYAYGLPDRDDAPEKDMPRTASNKARSNNHWAYIADIKTGWERSPLTRDERRSIFLSYAMGWTQRAIATHEGVSVSVVNDRINNGVKKITARLNGARIVEEEVTSV